MKANGWARGGVMGRAWLPVLPILAGCFDLLPGLSAIPLIPTMLHIGSILAGVMGTPAVEGERPRQDALNRKARIGAMLATGISITGLVFSYTTMKSRTERIAPGSVVSRPNDARASAPRPLDAKSTTGPASGQAKEQNSESLGAADASKNHTARKLTQQSGQREQSGTTTRTIRLDD